MQLEFSNSPTSELSEFRKLLDAGRVLSAYKLLETSEFASSSIFIYEKAKLLNHYGNYTASYDLCAEIICKDKSFFLAYALMADNLYHANKDKRAVEFWSKAEDVYVDSFDEDDYFDYDFEENGDYVKSLIYSHLDKRIEHTELGVNDLIDDVDDYVCDGKIFQAYNLLLSKAHLEISSIDYYLIYVMRFAENLGVAIEYCWKIINSSRKDKSAAYTSCLLLYTEIQATTLYEPLVDMVISDLPFLSHDAINRFVSQLLTTNDDRLIKKFCEATLALYPLSICIHYLAIANYNLKLYDEAIQVCKDTLIFDNQFKPTEFLIKFITSKINRKKCERLSYDRNMPTFYVDKILSKLNNTLNRVNYTNLFYYAYLLSKQNLDTLNYEELILRDKNLKFINWALLDTDTSDLEKIELISVYYYFRPKCLLVIFSDELREIEFQYPDDYLSYNEKVKDIFCQAAVLVTLNSPKNLKLLCQRFEYYLDYLSKQRITFAQTKYFAIAILLACRIPNLDEIDKIFDILTFDKSILMKYLAKLKNL